MANHYYRKNKRILFVCLGNICRSPAAEGILKHLVKEKGLEGRIEVDSAGLGPWHVGELPDHRMRKFGERHGYQFVSRARMVVPAHQREGRTLEYVASHRTLINEARIHYQANSLIVLRRFQDHRRYVCRSRL